MTDEEQAAISFDYQKQIEAYLKQKKPTTTDEELKEKLLARQWSSRRGATIPINPDGEAAWNRIEELEIGLNLAVHDADYLLDKATKQHNHIKELEAIMATIRDLAVPTTEGRTKSKRERLILIKNAVDDVLKGADDDG